MFINRLGFGILYPLLDEAGDGGGGGGMDTGGGGDTGGSGQVAEAASPIDVSDDTLVRIKGSKEPVKFADHVRGFQAQWTKASQEAARLKKELEARDARLADYERQRQEAGRQRQGGDPSQDVYKQLADLPYLSGKDAAAVVHSIAQGIQQRDMVLMGTLKELQKMQRVVDSLSNNHSLTSFDAKISKWVQDGGYPPEAADLAKEIYLAYEGDDLDTEFPQIFANRWNQLLKMTEAIRQQKVTAARKSPFVPGKGANVGPSQALKLDPRANPSQIVDALWDSMQSGSDT